MDMPNGQSEAGQAGPQRLPVCVSQCKWRTAYERLVPSRLCCSRLPSILIGCFHFRRHAIIHKLHFMIHAMKCIIDLYEMSGSLIGGQRVKTPMCIYYSFWWCLLCQTLLIFFQTVCNNGQLLTNCHILEVIEVGGNVTLAQFTVALTFCKMLRQIIPTTCNKRKPRGNREEVK